MQTQSIQQCPVCSRVLTFSSDKTNVTNCTGCGSTIIRTNDGTFLNKPLFPVIINPGVIQPGTTGVWEGKGFTVLGRFRAWFDESVFNYWTIQYADGNLAWLGEGYGIYSILTPSTSAKPLTSKDIKYVALGDRREVNETIPFILEKKYKTSKWEVEGELYIPDNTASSFTVLEFSNESDNIIYFEFKDDVFAFDAVYTYFGSLQLNNLRTYEQKGRTFTCSNCPNTIEVKTYPYAQSCACTACGTQYELKDLNFKVFKKDKASASIAIPLGSTGMIKGIHYEVIGYVEKEERNEYHSKWREYTLYNPNEGYAFLSEYDGNWIYIRENYNSPVVLNVNSKEVDYEGKEFKIFNSYVYKVNTAFGEYPYNIYDNKDTQVKEFISPPQVWIYERDYAEGITWFLGNHIRASEIQDAFPAAVLPYKKGIGSVQPSGTHNRSKWALATVAGLLLLIFLHSFIASMKEDRQLFSKYFAFPDSINHVSFVTDKFFLGKFRSNVHIKIESPVDNTWFELSATMVNAETGKEYSIEKGIEKYSGYSDGESWTEGSSSGEAFLTRIPAGSYFFQLQGTTENLVYMKPHGFEVIIDYDVSNIRNMWWSIVFLLVWPIGRYFFSGYVEKARWSNSPFSPYSS